MLRNILKLKIKNLIFRIFYYQKLTLSTSRVRVSNIFSIEVSESKNSVWEYCAKSWNDFTPHLPFSHGQKQKLLIFTRDRWHLSNTSNSLVLLIFRLFRSRCLSLRNIDSFSQIFASTRVYCYNICMYNIKAFLVMLDRTNAGKILINRSSTFSSNKIGFYHPIPLTDSLNELSNDSKSILQFFKMVKLE